MNTVTLYQPAATKPVLLAPKTINAPFPAIDNTRTGIPFYESDTDVIADLKSQSPYRAKYFATMPGTQRCSFAFLYKNYNGYMTPTFQACADNWLFCRKDNRSLWLDDGTIQYQWGEVHLLIIHNSIRVGRLHPPDGESQKTHIAVSTDTAQDSYNVAIKDVDAVYIVQNSFSLKRYVY